MEVNSSLEDEPLPRGIASDGEEEKGKKRKTKTKKEKVDLQK